MDDAPRWLLFFALLLLAGFYRCGMLARTMQAEFHRPHITTDETENDTTFLCISYLSVQLACFWYGYFLLAPLIKPLPVLFELLLFFLGIAFVFGMTTLLPRNLVRANPDGFLRRTHPLLTLMTFPFVPLSLLAGVVSSLITTLLRLKTPRSSEQLTEEQLRDLVDVSEESGLIEEQERTMIHNIFDFDQIEVSALMTHRTDIIGVGINDTVQDVVHLALEHGFSRLPVYDGDLDNIKGVLFVKDFLCFVGAKGAPGRPLTDFVRPTLFIPEAQKCTDLLGLFKQDKTHIAIVVDDFGGTAGIISMEDLLEAIVGNIQDEYDHEQELITKLDQHVFSIDGATPLEELERLFSCTFACDPDTTTISGLVTSELGRIPLSGETPKITIAGIPFWVTSVGENRIATLQVDLREIPPASSAPPA